MALAINLLFDRQTSLGVEAIWKALGAAQVSSDMLTLLYPPHVTLVVVDDEALVPNLRAALDLGQGRAAMPMQIGPVRRFPGTSITWLAAQGDGLVDLHAAVAGSVPLDAIRAHYRPSEWTPHVTLQTMGSPEAGEALARPMWPNARPASAIRLDLCSFLPVVTLGGTDLVG